MLVDHRTYTTRPGMLPAFVKLYEEVALPVQKRHLGTLLGYFTVESGPLNQVVFMWGYADAGDRERRRVAMEADPDWAEYRRQGAALGALVHQETKLLRPTAFSPIR
ncbi:MAG: NIPSNAP family protein [Alphaproteobacteria bacterium]|nr:NIPSNAP family protein [Alphaproteobacteria bacterium]